MVNPNQPGAYRRVSGGFMGEGRHKHALHFAQVGHFGEGLCQRDDRAHVDAAARQVVVGKTAAKMDATSIKQENGG